MELYIRNLNTVLNIDLEGKKVEFYIHLLNIVLNIDLEGWI